MSVWDATAIRGVGITADQRAINWIVSETDNSLIILARDGHVDAYGQLIERYQRSVYGIVSRMIEDRDDVDDIVQDVFLLAYRSLLRFRMESTFSTWLYRIAVNTTLKQIKRCNVRRGYSIDDPDTGLAGSLASDDNPSEEVERLDRHRQVRKAISKLSDKHRMVVVLYYYEEYSCEDIAAIMQCSVGTVWSRLHYACKKLKGQLGWIGGLRDV